MSTKERGPEEGNECTYMNVGEKAVVNDESTYMNTEEARKVRKSFSLCLIYILFTTIHMYSGITNGRVLNGELLYTKILE